MGASLIIDKFLDDWGWFRDYCDQISYDGQVNPVDGVVYPGINASIPPGIYAEVITKAQRAIGKRITNIRMFLRLSTTGMEPPHQAHTDSTMGDYALMLYMNREEDSLGGTAFIRHRSTGMDSDPQNDDELAIWQRDTNNQGAWDVTHMCEMTPNRATIFPSSKMHRAEPVGGFGSKATDGRLVLTAFIEV